MSFQQPDLRVFYGMLRGEVAMKAEKVFWVGSVSPVSVHVQESITRQQNSA